MSVPTHVTQKPDGSIVSDMPIPNAGASPGGSGLHTHPISDVVGLQAELNEKADTGPVALALSGKSNTGHVHIISDVTGLQGAIDAKAATVHTHAISDVTNLQ